MGILGILALFFWGMAHLPTITCWVVVLFLFYAFIVALLQQFGLAPKPKGKR